MKILLLGANGQVGWELHQLALQREFSIVPLSREQLDITELVAVGNAIRDSQPTVVINAAAYTAVDQAEKEQDNAYAANRDAPAGIARACAEQQIPLLHISTDYVFDGDQQVPYQEDDPVNPLGCYGLSKWQGEEAVRQHLAQHIILRTSWVYGIQGHNFVKTILRLAQERNALKIVNDQWGCPTPAADIAAALLAICEHLGGNETMQWGTYHYSGKSDVTWFGFAEKIINHAKSQIALSLEQLLPITTEEFPTLAIRPKYTVLNCDKITKTFGIEPANWENSLGTLVQAILANQA